MFKLVVVTDLDRLPKNAKRFVEHTLGQLSYNGSALVYQVPKTTADITPALFENCDAVVARPTDLVKLVPDLFPLARDKVHIFSVSSGIGYLKQFQDDRRFTIVRPVSPFTNARGVAIFNVMMALSLFHSVPTNASNVLGKRFESTTEQTNLVDKNWLALGSGEQVARLLEVAHLCGVRKFFVWNDKLDEEKFEKCLSFLQPIAESRIQSDGMRAELTVPATAKFSERKIDIVGVRDLDSACQEADIVSVHMEHQEADSPSRRGNTSFVCDSFLRKLTRRPILINTARGELIDEVAVLAALKEGRLRGVAVDVLNAPVERGSIFSRSDLWQYRLEAHDENPNLLITPHIAGSVDSDLLPMWAFTLGELQKVINETRP